MKPRKKEPRGRSQARSQTPQCERKRRVASILRIKFECLCIAAATSLVPGWSFPSTQASLIPNGGSSVLMFSAYAKTVCQVYVRILLPTVVRLAPRSQAADLSWCMFSIGAQLADKARIAALKAFVQWANRIGVPVGSRTREGTLPANRGASRPPRPSHPRWDHPFVGP